MPVHCVYPHRDGVLVATDHGLLVSDSAGKLGAFYNRDSGLDVPAIGALETDDTFIWLGTLGGGLASVESAALQHSLESSAAIREKDKRPFSQDSGSESRAGEQDGRE